jgi:hypothetical protein
VDDLFNYLLQIKKHFSYKKTIKISNTREVLNSFTETRKKKTFTFFILRYKFLQYFFFSVFFTIKETREVANCVLKDMIHLTLM